MHGRHAAHLVAPEARRVGAPLLHHLVDVVELHLDVGLAEQGRPCQL